jgi:hypothetical protein
MYAQVTDNAITATRGNLPPSARRLDDGRWVLGLPTAPTALVEACGWYAVADVAAPAVTAAEVAVQSLAVVDGRPVHQWTVRAKTADELAADTAATVSTDLRTKMRAALADNATFLALASPTQAQTLAQVRRLTRQTNALIRATVGADLLTVTTDV